MGILATCKLINEEAVHIVRRLTGDIILSSNPRLMSASWAPGPTLYHGLLRTTTSSILECFKSSYIQCLDSLSAHFIGDKHIIFHVHNVLGL
jgi:hypothetical protein